VDGSAIAFSSALTVSGRIPVAAPTQIVTEGHGVFGWLEAQPVTETFEGDLRWTHPASVEGAEEIDTTYSVTAFLYQSPARGERAIRGLDSSGTALVWLAESDLPSGLSKQATITKTNSVQINEPGADRLRLILAAGSGVIFGSFVDAAGVRHPIFGVVVNQGEGLSSAVAGFSLGDATPGAFWLSAPTGD
jgi:hypothetical protein